MQKRTRSFYWGALLVVWQPVWSLLGHWSTVDFLMQKLRDFPVLSFFLGPIGANVVTLLGVALIVAAFVRVEQKMENIKIATPPLSAVSADIEAAQNGRLLCCTSFGIRGLTKRKAIWEPNGSRPAAVAVIKNTGKEPLRNVHASATFYDGGGRKVGWSRVHWIDEPHDNTGLLSGEEKTMAIAVQGTGGSTYFQTPYPTFLMAETLKATNLRVSVALTADKCSFYHLIFTMTTNPEPQIQLTGAED